MSNVGMDAIFNHVEAARKCLEHNEPEKALRHLNMIRGHLAAETLRRTNADVGSPHYHTLIRVVAQAFPLDSEGEAHIDI